MRIFLLTLFATATVIFTMLMLGYMMAYGMQRLISARNRASNIKEDDYDVE